ncbi:hypothetical protein BN1097_850003 [Clostridioides difficile]|uniref:Uncharacterized protein n=1 Tax=Clostridioides difficile TaxID=1496 RepID=A0A069AIG9_CLODI|nr:hypothetical protein BN1097_850003 [Clostridioides difficile]
MEVLEEELIKNSHLELEDLR